MTNLNEGQDRLLRIADRLVKATSTQPQEDATADFLWLADALRTIAGGGSTDMAKVLGIKAKRGQRTDRAAQKKRRNREMLTLSWLYTAMSPQSCDGLGLTLEEACALGGEDTLFGLTEETIRSYWGKRKELRKRLQSEWGFFNLED